MPEKNFFKSMNNNQFLLKNIPPLLNSQKIEDIEHKIDKLIKKLDVLNKKIDSLPFKSIPIIGTNEHVIINDSIMVRLKK